MVATQWISDWQHHALIELGSTLAGVQEYDRPGELANRLEGIARDLREFYDSAASAAPIVLAELDAGYRAEKIDYYIADDGTCSYCGRDSEPIDIAGRVSGSRCRACDAYNEEWG